MAVGAGQCIFMRPAWNSDNPFTRALANALVTQGAEVIELAHGWRRLPARPGILLLHWPDEFFYHRGIVHTARALATLARLGWLRFRHGQKLVWLVHNLEPHARTNRPFQIGKSLFFEMLDGAIFLSCASRTMFRARYAKLATLPALVTRHGHYIDEATRQPSLPRIVQGRMIRIGYAGRIKRYKAPDVLARVAAKLPNLVRLTITGEVDEPQLHRELTEIADNAANVSLATQYLTAQELEAEVDASDVIVMTYRDILNSGSALYALSRGRPFVGPRLGGLIELQADVGADWIWLYDGDLTPAILEKAARWVAETPRVKLPDLSSYDWPEIGKSINDFLLKL